MIISIKNKYIHRFVSKKKFHEIMRYFVLNIEAVKISKLVGISEILLEKSSNFRILVDTKCEKMSYFLGKIEIDESYFKAKKIRSN